MERKRRQSGRKCIDESYITRFQAGDVSAFAYIYDYYKDSLYYFSLKLMQNQADAEEVVQETFIRAYEKIHTLEQPKAFHAWLFSIAFNRSQSIHRKGSKMVGLGEETNLEEILKADNTQIGMVEEKEVFDAVKKELEQIPTKYAQVGMLKYFEGLSINEISEILEIPTGTVKTRLRRVRLAIKPGLASKGYGPRQYLSFAFTPFAFNLFQTIISDNALSSEKAVHLYESISENTDKIAAVGTGGAMLSNLAKTGFSTVTKAGIIAALGVGTIGSYVVYESLSLEAATIETIDYYKEYTNKDVRVKIVMDNPVNDERIAVTFNEGAITYDIDGNIVTFDAQENGEYKVQVDNDTQLINIDNIDKQAPRVEDIQYENDILTVLASDDLSGVDYDASKIVFNDKEVSLSQKELIEGELNGEVNLLIYDKTGNMISYVVSIEK